jgi:hypothetical protein
MTLALLATLIAAAPPPDAVPMTQESQVRELCAVLRVGDEKQRTAAAAVAYRLEVPAKGFAFGQYRADQQELELDDSYPLSALKGALTLDVDGIEETAFHAAPEGADEWRALKNAGSLTLVVTFRAAGPRCAGNPSAGIYRLEGTALRWELRSGNATVAASDEDGYPIDVKPGQSHSLKVHRVALDTDPSGEPPPSGRLAPVQRSLDACAQRAHRPGSMVVTFAVANGRIRDPQVIMDALRDDQVSACVARALAGAPIEGGPSRGTASLAVQ